MAFIWILFIWLIIFWRAWFCFVCSCQLFSDILRHNDQDCIRTQHAAQAALELQILTPSKDWVIGVCLHIGLQLCFVRLHFCLFFFLSESLDSKQDWGFFRGFFFLGFVFHFYDVCMGAHMWIRSSIFLIPSFQELQCLVCFVFVGCEFKSCATWWLSSWKGNLLSVFRKFHRRSLEKFQHAGCCRIWFWEFFFFGFGLFCFPFPLWYMGHKNMKLRRLSSPCQIRGHSSPLGLVVGLFTHYCNDGEVWFNLSSSSSLPPSLLLPPLFPS